jgi:hypothetical protein
MGLGIERARGAGARRRKCLCSTGGILGDKISTMTEDRMIARRGALDLDTCT